MCKKYIEVKESIDGYFGIAINITYTLGGMNYFSQSTDTRGIYVSLKPAEQITDDTGRVISTSCTILGSQFGGRVLLKELKRANKKVLANISELFYDHFTDQDYIDMVTTSNFKKIFTFQSELDNLLANTK